MKTAWRTFIEDETGLAMFTVMGVIAFMTVIVLGAFALSSNTLNTSQRVSQDTQAFQAANSGIDVALARMQAHGYVATDYPATGANTPGALYSAEVTPTSNSEYLCTSTGTYNGRSETIRVKFFYLNIWNMNLATGTNNALGGGSVKGTTSVFGPFYVRGSVELGSNGQIQNGPLFIRNGSLKLTGSGVVGSPGTPIDLYVTGLIDDPKGYCYTRSISNGVPDISLPLVDYAYMIGKYGLAKDESFDNTYGYIDSAVVGYEADVVNGMRDPSTYTSMTPPGVGARVKAPGASTFYKMIGDDADMGPVGQGTHGLTIGGTGSFGSWAGDGRGYTGAKSDDFAYDDVNNVLYCAGTVFVDGPLVLGEDMTFVGNGTIVANGPITVMGNFLAHTGGAGVDAEHCVGLVTPNDMVIEAGTNNIKLPTDPADIEGAFFTYGDFKMNNNILVKGSVLAATISFTHANEHLVTNPLLPTYLPKSMPGNGQSVLTKGAWVR